MLNSYRDETKKKVDKNIDDAFEKLKKRGNENTEERPLLMGIGKSLGEFAVKLSEFFKKAIDWIVNALKAIWNALIAAGKWVWDKITQAANAIKNFFGF